MSQVDIVAGAASMHEMLLMRYAIQLQHIIVQLQPHLHFSPALPTGQEPYTVHVKKMELSPN